MKKISRLLVSTVGLLTALSVHALPATDSSSATFEQSSQSSSGVDGTSALSIRVAGVDPNLVAPAIPEPTTAALLIGGLCLVAAVVRRRGSR